MQKTIAGYQIDTVLFGSGRSQLYRGRREADGTAVILKLLKQESPPPATVAWFKREFERTRELRDLSGVIDALDLVPYQHRYLMVLEDFGGQALSELKKSRRFTLEEKLQYAVAAADALGQVHGRDVIHKDVKPANLVLNPASGVLKIIDFGISTSLRRESTALSEPGRLEGTLAYMSPEQTGRMNRALDYRTDMYSLGASLYELFTGERPFAATEPLQLIHCHIARTPVPAHERSDDVPQAVSDIIARLMAKDAEQRYQSGRALEADLEACLAEVRAGRTSFAIELGAGDVSSRFQVPQRLYGRGRERDTLLAAFDRVSRGGSELFLVAGYSGIGKTALVQEVYKPLAGSRGLFVSGKFEQLRKNVPYAPFIQAFRSLLRRLLTRSEDEVAAWKKALLAACGANIRLLIDVIPELELVVGPQPEVPELDGTEAQNRFHLTFQRFVGVFATPEHALVLFLDDLQWADAASLKMIELLVTDPDLGHLFVICAYRDNEVGPGHPFLHALDEVAKAGVAPNRITLPPLGKADVTELVADTLHQPPDQVADLADLVLAKTGGNPFFMNELLKSLHADELIRFDDRRGAWTWDLQPIRASNITDNVVELMVGKLRRLSDATQRLLQLAACVGNRFELGTLAIIREASPRDTAQELYQALDDGVVVPLSDAYKVMEMDVADLAEEVRVEYRFAHDRVQQAAYQLIDAQARAPVHRRVGELLLASTPADEREARLFDIVDQLNLGRDAIEAPADLEQLVRLDLEAAHKATGATAFDAALGYAAGGVELLGRLDGEPWSERYELAAALHLAAAEAAYAVADYPAMDRYCEAILEHGRTVLERVQAHEIRLLAHSARDELLEGVELGLKVLATLGIDIPADAGPVEVERGLTETMELLAGRDIPALARLPEMTDPDSLAALQICLRLYIPAFSAKPEIFSLIVFEIVKMSLRNGNGPGSARGYAALGLILCGMVGNIDAGYQIGELSLRLIDRFQAKDIESSTVFIVGCFISHWKEHTRNSTRLMTQGYLSGLDTGDLEFAALSACAYTLAGFWGGDDLRELDRKSSEFDLALERMQQQHQLSLNRIYRQAVLNLMGDGDDPTRLVGSSYDEDDMLPKLEAANNVNELAYLHIYKLLFHFLYRQPDQAVAHADLAETYLPGIPSTPAIVPYHFYDSLARLDRYETSSAEEQAAILERVGANQAKLQNWAEHAPMNCRHKHLLVKAEEARVRGERAAARDLYDDAVRAAHEHGYLGEAALASELAGRFYLAADQPRVARHYLSDARYAYQRWGASAKGRDLEAQYPHILGAAEAAPAGAETALETVAATTAATMTTTATTTGGGAGALDLASVLKASQAIAGEIVLDRLLRNLMRIVIENAGAERGYLLLDKDGEWVIEAEGAIDSDAVQVLRSLPIEAGGEPPRLPPSLINYVARTQADVVLDNASSAEQFAGDPYVALRKPRSVACTPLLNQGKLSGILYLENNLADGAFTAERLEVLHMLSSQAAVSVENARLYSDIVALNRAYQRFVPHEFLEFLDKKSILDVELGDSVGMELTIMFLDIRSFTALSELQTPRENFEFANDYFRVTGPIVREHGGFIGKYTGDGMMAMFPTNPDRAIEASNAILRRLTDFNREREARGEVAITVGIGLNTGQAMLGTLGEANRMQGDAMSSAVNLAARIEGLTKKYGVSLLITGSTYRALGDRDRFHIRQLERVQVKGDSRPQTIYEVYDADPPELRAAKRATAAEFESARAQLQNGDLARALAGYQAVAEACPEDQAATTMAERLLAMKEESVHAWAGVMKWKDK